MLLKIREKSKGIFAYLLVGLIAIAFSLWGVDSLFTAFRDDPNEIAKVNSTSLSQMEVDRLAQRHFQQLLQNEDINPEQIDIEFLRQLALSSLIQEELLKQLAENNKMLISPYQIERQLVRMQVFQDEEGRFNQENFTQILRQEGLSPTAFRSQLQQELLNQQILNGLAASEFTLPEEVTDFQLLAGQQRSFRYKVFSAQDYLNQAQPTQEQIESFYAANLLSFQRPEQLKVNYVIFDPKTLQADLEPTQEELEAEFQNYLTNLKSQAASYSAAHILLEFSNAKEKQAAQKQLEQIKAEVEAGASFAAKAEEFSADFATKNTGGELGEILAGSFNSDFETALFNLDEVGQLSEPVETNYGLHLIQLTNKQSAKLPSFKEVETELKHKLLAQPLREATEAKLEELTNLSFSAANLDELAQETGLTISTSPWLIKNQLESFWQEKALVAAIFNKDLIEDAWLTEPIQLENGTYLIAQKNTYQEQKQLELAEVESQVSAAVKQNLALELAEKAATKEIAAANTSTWQEVKLTERNNPELPRGLTQQAFKLGLKQPLQLVKLNSAELALIQLKEIVPGKLAETTEDKLQLNLGLTSTNANRIQEVFMQQLEQDAKIILR